MRNHKSAKTTANLLTRQVTRKKFITTNESDPLLKLSDISDLKAIERRFIIGSISELEKAPTIDRLYSVNRAVSDEIIIEILRHINSKLHTHDCHSSLHVAKEYVSAFAQAILLEEERQSDGVGASHIEGGSVPHRGAASSEGGDSAGPSRTGKELAPGDTSPLHVDRNGSRRRANKRKRTSKKTESAATGILPEKKARVSSEEAPRKQRAPLVYEELSQDDVDPNDRPNGGVLREPTENSGKQTILVSALSLQHGNSDAHSGSRMDCGRRDEVAPLLGDRSLTVPAGGDIVAAALSTALAEPTSDEELLAFAAEIELGTS